MKSKSLWQNWRFIRLLRLLLGLAALVQAIVLRDVLLSALGIVLLLMAVFNMGCFNGISCAVNTSGRTNKNTVEDVEYEKVNNS
jgi:hypothetical protein